MTKPEPEPELLEPHINHVVCPRCQVTAEETRHHKEVVDKLGTFFREQLPFVVAECFTGGFSTKGTAALRGHSDVDIVLYLNDAQKPVSEIGCLRC